MFVEDENPFVYISGGGEFQKMGKPFENSVCSSPGKTGIVRGADAEVCKKIIKKIHNGRNLTQKQENRDCEGAEVCKK